MFFSYFFSFVFSGAGFSHTAAYPPQPCAQADAVQNSNFILFLQYRLYIEPFCTKLHLTLFFDNATLYNSK